MPNTDLVVVVPGIMGSTLESNGKTVWAPTAGALLQGIFTLGKSLKALQLPDGIGDENPDDRVEPRSLVGDLHAIPGIWSPIRGYDALLKRLRQLSNAGSIGNVLPVPYDWRLSNRYNGKRLAGIVEDEFEQWRKSDPSRADARLVFLCHSMADWSPAGTSTNAAAQRTPAG